MFTIKVDDTDESSDWIKTPKPKSDLPKKVTGKFIQIKEKK